MEVYSIEHFSIGAPTVWCNKVKSDARIGAPTPVWAAEAKLIRKGKPEAVSPAAEGPTQECRTKNEVELILSAGGAREPRGRGEGHIA